MVTDIKENSNFEWIRLEGGGKSEKYNNVKANLPMTKSDLIAIKANF